MITRRTVGTALIHFEPLPGRTSPELRPGLPSPPTPDYLARIAWYAEWALGTARSVHLLLAPQFRSLGKQILAASPGVSLVWYDHDLRLPGRRRSRETVWLINGNQMPIVYWSAACSAARRRDSDLLMFALRAAAGTVRYPESVIVDGTGRVVRFCRHYFDSPSSPDYWSGEAGFLAASGNRIQPIAAHIALRGWGLESIGALTRRFSMRWAAAPCLLSTFRPEPRPSWQNRFDAQWSLEAEAPLRRKPARTPRLDRPAPGDESWSERMHDPRPIAASGVDPSPAETNDLPDETIVIADDPAYRAVKRISDVAGALIGLIVLSPLLLLVACLVKATSRGPVLFGHKRQGLNGREFLCWKFRSMRDGADDLQAKLRSRNEVDGPQFKIADDPRLSPIGAFLRHRNIDELPQLFNVLAGQMSFVGPRPSPDGENQLCPAWRRARLSVRPGITGLWQILRLRVDGSSDFQEWIYYDIEYVKHRSLWLDLQVLLHTPIAILRPRRIAQFAGRLERFGICPHSPHVRPAATSEPAARVPVSIGA